VDSNLILAPIKGEWLGAPLKFPSRVDPLRAPLFKQLIAGKQKQEAEFVSEFGKQMRFGG